MIRLDPDLLDQYPLVPQPTIAPLADLADVKNADGALRFAEEHGLLRTGPSASRPTKSLRELLNDARAYRETLELYEALDDTGSDDLETLARMWPVAIRALRASGLEGVPDPPFDRDLISWSSLALEAAVNEGLDGTEERIRSATRTDIVGSGPPDPRRFEYRARSHDLLGFFYWELSRRIVGGVDVRACAECGRYFEVTDPRRTYCDKRCQNRATYKRGKSNVEPAKRTTATAVGIAKPRKRRTK